MEVLSNAVQGVLSIIFMIGIGYILSHKGWFDKKSAKLLSKLVVSLALPCYMIYNLVSNYDRQKLSELKNGLPVPFITMIFCYLIAMATAKIIKVPKNRNGTFCSMMSLSNTIFIGLPVNRALFGEDSVQYVLVYYIANTTLFWTLGVYGISSDGDAADSKLFSAKNIRRIFSPPLIAFIIGIFLILLKIPVPKVILSTCGYMGNLTTPLSMLFIGTVMYSVDLRKIKFDKDMALLLAGRFIIAPAVVTGIVHLALPISVVNFTALPKLMKQVFIIQSAMPAMTQTPIIAETYNADYKYAAIMTTITTIASLISIPFYMLMLEFII